MLEIDIKETFQNAIAVDNFNEEDIYLICIYVYISNTNSSDIKYLLNTSNKAAVKS